MGILVGLISGAVGGNAAGGLLKGLSLGALGNTLAGLVGGGLGTQILGMTGGVGMAEMAAGASGMAGNMDIGPLIGQVAFGAVGGAVLLVVVGMVKNRVG